MEENDKEQKKRNINERERKIRNKNTKQIEKARGER